MLRALLWKEWREQRAIAFVGAGLALAIPFIVIAMASGSGYDDRLYDVSDVVPFLCALVVWPLFAALAGATANSESVSPASAGFLFSRPVPRVVLWLVKVVIAGVTIGFVVAVSFYVALRVDVWVGGWGFRFPFSSDPFAWPPDDAVRGMTLGALYVAFGGAVFLSTFLRRAVAAALGGLGLALAVQFGALFVAGRLSSDSLGSGAGAFIDVLSEGLAAGLLLASLYVFRRAGHAGGADARRQARRAGAGVVLLLPFIVVLAAFTATRSSPETARVGNWMPVPGTDLSVVSLIGNAFTGDSVWAVEPGRSPRRLTARMADPVAVSPDGEWLVYVSRLTAFGTRSSRCALRAVRLDGSDDHVLASVVGQRWGCDLVGEFDADAQRIALRVGGAAGGERLMVADLRGDDAHYVDISSITPRDGYWWFRPHWISRDSLWLDSTYRGSRGYWRVEIDGDGIESMYRPMEEDAAIEMLASSTSRLLIREVERPDSMRLPPDDTPPRESIKLIDLADGTVREIAPLCPPAGEAQRTIAVLIAGGRHAFFTCRPSLPRDDAWETIDPDELFHGSLRRRDLATGEDVSIAELDGYVASLGASPDGSRFMVRLARPREVPAGLRGTFVSPRDRRLAYRYVLVRADGTVRALDITPEWSMAGWLGNNRVMLLAGRYNDVARPMAYLELSDDGIALRPLHLAGGSRP